MTLYQDTYQLIDSPLSEMFEPLYEENEWDESQVILIDPAQQVQQRMLLIIGIVSILVIMFALFVLPNIVRTNMNGKAAQSSENTGQAEAEAKEGVTTTTANPRQAATSAISPLFSPEVQHWGPQITAWAKPFGLDPNLVATIMQIESCGDPQAISGAGAQGLFQVMPFHFSAGENMLDPNTNATRGVNYFAERLQQTNGEIGNAFAGYNGGHVASSGSWNSWLPETQRYYTWSTGIYGDIQAGLSESPTLQQWMAAGGASLCQQASARLNLTR